MASDSHELKTFNVKKDKKLQAKKRKLEAFLNLVRKDEETLNSMPKKKSNGSVRESYMALKDELKKYQTKQVFEPSFFLTDEGRSAIVNFSSNGMKCVSPLFLEDVYHLLLKALLANLSPFSLRWSKLERPKNINKTVLIEIDGLLPADITEMNSELNQKNNIFPYVFEIVSSKIPFATEISTLHLAAEFYNKANGEHYSLFPMEEHTGKETKLSGEKCIVSKLHLLLSPIQMSMEYYPLPHSVFEQSNGKGYIFSKESYTPVTADSPMFALDCEMCRTTSGKHEVTRIAIVNEDLETVYHTLVKPRLPIIDYMTHFSGVTKKMLEKVTTTLEDVHAEMRKILPSDAILCGQSLNCDLHALKIIHPYVIDTSVIFNKYGLRNRKTSLKQLARIHLKETIQDNKKGHHPIEDSIATMKLVQLKLENCIQYKDVILTQEPSEESKYEMDIITKCPEEKRSDIVSNLQKNPKFSDFVKLNTGPEYCGFFERISKCSKKVCLIGNEDALNNYCLEIDYDGVHKVIESSNKAVLETTSNNLPNCDLIISHLKFKEENFSMADVNESLKQIYEHLPSNTLFLLIACVDRPGDKTFKHSYCMSVLKNVKVQ